jgi:hypothetical protein
MARTDRELYIVAAGEFKVSPAAAANLRLAAWYRDFAERAANPAIWDARLRTAEELEKEAGSRRRTMTKS